MPLWRVRSKRPRTEPGRDGLSEADAALRDSLDRLLVPFEPWLGEGTPAPRPRPEPARAAAAPAAAPAGPRIARERLVVRYSLPPAIIVA